MNKDNSDVVSPHNFNANDFILAMGSREFGLILGQARHVFESQTGDHVKQIKDWHASYSLSPVTAKQLWAALGDAIKNYENKFGVIPEDQLELRGRRESNEITTV